MGLRLVAHYHDRHEAMIALGALDAVGVRAFLHGYHINAMRPLHESALGGYRLMAVDEEVPVAVALLREARRKRSFEGGRLVKDQCLAMTLLLFGATWLGAWLLIGFPFPLWLPFARYKWIDVEGSAALG